MAPVRLVSFDVYGTLVRFHEAVEATLAAVVAENGWSADTQRLRARWRATQGPLQQGWPWRPYKDVIRWGLAEAFAREGLPYRGEYGDRLVAAISAAEPFPEVEGVLGAVQAGARVMFISNTDEDMIAGNLARMRFRPDLVVTAERSKLYKPAHGMFRHAYARAGVDPGEVVHVAAGFHHDIEPATALGMRRVWVNRRGEAGDARFAPYAEIADLAPLPALLAEERW